MLYRQKVVSTPETAQFFDAPLWHRAQGIHPMKTAPNTAVLLTLPATFFSGSSFQATRFALSVLPPWTASVERFLIAVAGLFLIMAIKEGVRRDIFSRNFLSFILLVVIVVSTFNRDPFF